MTLIPELNVLNRIGELINDKTRRPGLQFLASFWSSASHIPTSTQIGRNWKHTFAVKLKEYIYNTIPRLLYKCVWGEWIPYFASNKSFSTNYEQLASTSIVLEIIRVMSFEAQVSECLIIVLNPAPFEFFWLWSTDYRK